MWVVTLVYVHVCICCLCVCVCVHVCVCVCVYMCLCVCVYACTFVCVCMYVYNNMYVCVYMYMCVCMYVCVCACKWWLKLYSGNMEGTSTEIASVKMAHKKALKKNLHWWETTLLQQMRKEHFWRYLLLKQFSMINCFCCTYIQKNSNQNIRKILMHHDPSRLAMAVVKRIMVATFDGRRKSDKPSIEQVLDVFPPLKESNWVRTNIIVFSS